MQNQAHIFTLVKKKNTVNLKLVILLQYQKIKILLQKVTLQIGLKFFVIKKIENTVPWTYVISSHNGEKFF